MKKNLKNKALVILSLGFLSAIGPFSIDMYLPGFNEIAKDLNTTISHIGLSLSSFFIGISVGQLIYGPLLDRYGRKIPLYIGLIIYIVASLACVLVQNADQLIALRFFQALGSCAGMVAGRALVRDLFPVDEIAKTFSYLMLVIALSPILAPTFGGFLTTSFEWQAIFVVLAIIGFLTLLSSIKWIPAANPPDKEKSLKPGPIINEYLKVAKVPQFYIYSAVSSIAFSRLYAYISGSADLFLNIFHLSQKEYGLIFAIISIGMTIGGQVNTFLLRNYSSETISFTALIIQFVISLTMLIVVEAGWINLYVVVAFICLYLSMLGLVFPNTSALTLEPFTRNAGTASALMGAVQLGCGALIAGIVNLVPNNHGLTMFTIMLLCSVLSLLIYQYGRTRKLIRKGLSA